MQQQLLLGDSDFDKIIEKNALFVDKSLFIQEFVNDGAQVIAILRPRRFGKSTNLSMLKSFFSLGSRNSKFSQYLIGNENGFLKTHCGKYPVVYLNLKDCSGPTWESMYQQIWRRIRAMVRRHKADLSHIDLGPFELDKARSTVSNDQSFVEGTLEWLVQSLCETFEKRVIVLIDEYDAPLNRAFRKGYYDQASAFFESFYSSALKDNSALEKACLMGVVEVRGAGILTGLN